MHMPGFHIELWDIWEQASIDLAFEYAIRYIIGYSIQYTISQCQIKQNQNVTLSMFSIIQFTQ